MTHASWARSWRGLVIATTCAALASAPRGVRAQPDAVHAHAMILSAEGDKHYALTEYEPAIAAYKEAYRLVPAPLLLFNIARSYRLLGACQQARTFFKNYLSTGDTEYGERAAQRVAAIDAGTDDKCVPGKVIDPPPPAPRVDPVGPGIGNTTGGDGAHADDHDPPGPTPAVEPRAGVVDAPPSDLGPTVTAAVHPGRGKRVVGLVTLGVGVIFAATGGYFSVAAHQADRDIEAACAAGCEASAVAGLDADGKAAQRNATLSYAAGGVAIAVGAAVLVWGWHDGRGGARHVALAPTATGALAIAGWSF